MENLKECKPVKDWYLTGTKLEVSSITKHKDVLGKIVLNIASNLKKEDIIAIEAYIKENFGENASIGYIDNFAKFEVEVIDKYIKFIKS